MKIIFAVFMVVLAVAAVRWSVTHWRRQVLPAYPYPLDEQDPSKPWWQR